MVEHLETIGLGMPLELARKPGLSLCEGLRDVLLSRADLSVQPPRRFLPRQPVPPLAVLFAFELMLEEVPGLHRRPPQHCNQAWIEGHRSTASPGLSRTAQQHHRAAAQPLPKLVRAC